MCLQNNFPKQCSQNNLTKNAHKLKKQAMLTH